MPRPVEAFPCGSISITRVGSPTAARAVPRFMAVVVLPTPPFWLATTRTRGFWGSDMTGAQLSHAHYSSRWVGLALDLRGLHAPIFSGFGQFRPNILAFQKEANSVRTCEPMGIIQQQGQGGKRARRHHVKGAVRQVFHPGIADFDLKAHAVCGGLQEG